MTRNPGRSSRAAYLAKEETQQILRPDEVIDGLLQNIFRIKNVLDAVVSVVALATIMAIVLVFALSLRLRQGEIQTIFKIGCSRLTIAKLLAAEILIIVAASQLSVRQSADGCRPVHQRFGEDAVYRISIGAVYAPPFNRFWHFVISPHA